MKLKRFEALSLQEALQAVKAELGPDAVIVSSRRIQKGSGLFGLLTQTVIEVTAAVDRSPDVEPAQSSPDRSLQALLDKQMASDTVSIHQSPAQNNSSFTEQLQVATALDPVTQQLQDMREEIKRMREEQRDPELVLSPLRQELEGLRIVVGEALESQMRRRIEGLPGEVTELYQALISHGVQPTLAHQLLRSVVETLGTAGMVNSKLVNELLWERMEEALTVSGPNLSRSSKQKIMMLVGPTGVGKTTTIAKLAGLARQQDENRKTVLITLDTYRVAAVEQLRVYAKILKIPLEVAVSQQDFMECLRGHQEADLILIDTAGRSPRDHVGHEELMAITRGQFNIETHLVLAAPVTESVLLETIRRYQSIPVHQLIITKIDETPSFGGMYNVLTQTGLPISFLSDGQQVPEDLERATRKRLVELVWRKSCQALQESSMLAEVGN